MRLMMLVALLLFTGCASQVVRDAETYRAELAFLEAAATRSADAALIAAEDAAKSGNLGRCEQLAKDALVARVRVPWHVAKALALAELGDDPGETPPPIDPPGAWCEARIAPAPIPTARRLAWTL